MVLLNHIMHNFLKYTWKRWLSQMFNSLCKYINTITYNKKILIKLTLSFISVSTASVILLSVLFSYYSDKQNIKNIDSMNRLALTNIDNVSAFLFDLSKRNAFEVYNNSTVKNLLNNYNADIEGRFFASQYLQKVILSNPHIFSIYLWKKDKLYMEMGGNYTVTETDNEVNTVLKQSSILTPNPRIVKGLHNSVKIYSFVYYETQNSELIESAVIVNVKAEYLYSLLFADNHVHDYFTYLINKNGIILMSNNINDFSRKISEGFKKAVSSEHTNYSSYIDLTEKDKKLISFVVNKKSSIITLSSINYVTYFKQVAKTRNILIVVSVLMLIIVLSASVLLSYKFFTPINNVFTNIKTLFRSIDNNETEDYIKTSHFAIALEKIIDKMNALQMDKQTSFHLLKQDFLRSMLLFDRQISVMDLTDKLAHYDILPRTYSYYYITVLRISQQKDFCKKNTPEAIEFQLNAAGNIACDVLKAPDRNITFTVINNDHLVLFIGLSNPDFSVSSELFYTKLSELQTTIYKLLKLEITIGVSERSDTLSEFRANYLSAFKLTNYRLVYGSLSIFSLSSLVVQDIEGENIHTLTLACTNAVKAGDINQFTLALNKLFAVIKTSNYEHIFRVFFNLATSIINIPSELQLISNNTENKEIEGILSSIKDFENFSDLESWFKDLFLKTRNVLDSIQNRKYPELIDKILFIVNEQYMDCTLSAAILADKLSITPQYLSRVFNDNFKISFPDYINGLRLEKSKELLLSNPNLTIARICEMIGYNNSSYFAAAFKHKYGISPSKLRNSASSTDKA